MYNTNDIIRHYESVICKSSSYNSPKPVTDINLLYPPFYLKLKKSIEEFQSIYPGIIVGIGETYRSRDLQLHYFKIGSSKTTGGAHGLGLAADVHVNNKYYHALRKIFVKNGLYILGNWDLGHVQYIPVSDQSALWKSVAGVCNSDYLSVPNKDQKTVSSISPLLFIAAVGAGIALVINLFDDSEEYE